MEWFKPRSVATERWKFKVQALKNNRSQKLDVSFVSLVSGTVSLLLQSLVGGFTGHFTASRQPMATGKSPRPQSSLNVSTSSSAICKAQTVFEYGQSITALSGDTFFLGCSSFSYYKMKPVLLCFDTLYWGLMFSYYDFNSFFVCFFVLVRALGAVIICQFNLDHWGCFAFPGLVICLLSLTSFLNFASLFECISFIFLHVL